MKKVPIVAFGDLARPIGLAEFTEEGVTCEGGMTNANWALFPITADDDVIGFSLDCDRQMDRAVVPCGEHGGDIIIPENDLESVVIDSPGYCAMEENPYWRSVGKRITAKDRAKRICVALSGRFVHRWKIHKAIVHVIADRKAVEEAVIKRCADFIEQRETFAPSLANELREMPRLFGAADEGGES